MSEEIKATIEPLKKKYRTVKSAWKSSGAWFMSNCGGEPNSKECRCIAPALKEVAHK